MQQQRSGMALASLILGATSFICLLTSIPAIILGHIAYYKAKQEPQIYGGKGMAIAGFTLGYVFMIATFVGIIAAIAIPKYMSTVNKAKATVVLQNTIAWENKHQAFFQEKALIGGNSDIGWTDPQDPNFTITSTDEGVLVIRLKQALGGCTPEDEWTTFIDEESSATGENGYLVFSRSEPANENCTKLVPNYMPQE